MRRIKKNNHKIAILVDGENINCKYIDSILELLGYFGNVTIRRVYGNFNSPFMKNWKAKLVTFEMKQVQPDTTGKNSTDWELGLDATEVLRHNHSIDCYCIASGDSDFLPLVHFLKKHGKTVIGVGNKYSTSRGAPKEWDDFYYIEHIPFFLIKWKKAAAAKAAKPTPEEPVKVVRPVFKSSSKIGIKVVDKIDLTGRGTGRRKEKIKLSYEEQLAKILLDFSHVSDEDCDTVMEAFKRVVEKETGLAKIINVRKNLKKHKIIFSVKQFSDTLKAMTSKFETVSHPTRKGMFIKLRENKQ